MATRSNIAVHRMDGTWKRIYCHFDGYLDGVGKTLLAHHNSQDLAEAVVEPGDMSYLAENSGKPDGHSFKTPVQGYSVYYGRDRGEEDVAGQVVESFAELSFYESPYVWSREHGAPDGAWYAVNCDGTPVPLAEAIQKGDDVIFYGDDE